MRSAPADSTASVLKHVRLQIVWRGECLDRRYTGFSAIPQVLYQCSPEDFVCFFLPNPHSQSPTPTCATLTIPTTRPTRTRKMPFTTLLLTLLLSQTAMSAPAPRLCLYGNRKGAGTAHLCPTSAAASTSSTFAASSSQPASASSVDFHISISQSTLGPSSMPSVTFTSPPATSSSYEPTSTSENNPQPSAVGTAQKNGINIGWLPEDGKSSRASTLVIAARRRLLGGAHPEPSVNFES